jgi:signal transduction histidine kinase
MKRFAMFAKEGARERPQLESVDLSTTLNDILPLIRHELEIDKITLFREFPEGLPAVYADRRNVEEIFFNLIVNACQAMREGGRLGICATQKNGSVEIKIEDQGPGISRDDLSKVFEPFYTTKESGTGLGLYIVKQLVEKNKGKIWVESKVGSGTTFYVSFKALENERLGGEGRLADKRDVGASTLQG